MESTQRKDAQVDGQFNGVAVSVKRTSNPETVLQRNVAAYLTIALVPVEQGGAYWTAINPLPSQGAKLGAMRKAMGMKAGIPDLMFLWRKRVLFVELKPPGVSTPKDQQAVHALMISTGAIVTVCHSVDAVKAFIELTGIPTRDVSTRRAA